VFLVLSCSEGILWHVLTTPIKISQSLLTKYEEAVGDVYCPEARTAPHSEIEESGIKPTFKLPPKDKRAFVGRETRLLMQDRCLCIVHVCISKLPCFGALS